MLFHFPPLLKIVHRFAVTRYNEYLARKEDFLALAVE